MESVHNYTTGIDTKFFSKEDLALIDVKGLEREHIVIRWKKVDENICVLIRDLIKTQFSLPYKWLEPNDEAYEYVAQKSNTAGGSTDIKTAEITIEPLNKNYKYAIARIPINQKLDLDTDVELDHQVPYRLDPKNNPEGKIPDRVFIHSGLLKFHGTSIPSPILNHWHIGSQDIGSMIRAHYKVRYVDLTKGRFRLWNFRRNDNERCFVLSVWKCYGLSLLEVLNMILNYVKNDYVEPKIYKVGANDYLNNILDRKKLESFLESLIAAVTKAGEFKRVEIVDLVQSMKA